MIVLAAVLLGSTVKAVTGMGLPIISIPITALFVDLDTAVVTIAFANLLSNGILAAREREHHVDTRDLPALAGFGVIGAAIGVTAFVNLPEGPLVTVLIVAIVVYVITFFLKPDLQMPPERSRTLAPVVGTVAGAFQAAIGISGPIVGSWIHSYRLPRGAHILSVTSLFLVSGFVQFVVLVATGQFAGRVTASLLICLPVLATIPLGTNLRSRISSRGFDLAVIALLVISVGALVVKSLA